MKKSKRYTFEIALSGISTALALICLVLYYYALIAKIAFLAMAGVALVLPLVAKSIRGCALAYLAVGGLAFAICTPVAVVPYALLFGWQPVVMGLCNRYLAKKPYISIPIKAVLFNAGLYGVYALYGLGGTVNNIFAKMGVEPIYWVVALVGTVLWIGYDYLMQLVQKWMERKLHKVVVKFLPDEDNGANGAQNAGNAGGTIVQDDPFAYPDHQAEKIEEESASIEEAEGVENEPETPEEGSVDDSAPSIEDEEPNEDRDGE